MELELFHGTNKDQAEEICRNKPCIPKSGSYPGDVGRGFYNFYENENYEYSISAVQAATRYADKYRDTPSAVVKTLVDFNPERVLDLNIDSNYSRLIQFKSKAQEVISKTIEEYQRLHPNSRVSKRANPDGIAIERFIDSLPENPVIILWDRWEDIEHPSIKMKSGQIPNCKVAVIRDLRIIKKQNVI